MSGGVMDADTVRRVRAALRDAEQWTAKYIADNDGRAEVAGLVDTARRALGRISSTCEELGRFQR